MRSNRLRLLLVSVMAVFAISAVASASASAVPTSFCYKVAVMGTGNKDSSCITNAGATANEYINVEKLENQIKASEWCAKVFTAGTGTFEDAKCEKAKVKGEFIKVVAFNKEWEVCKIVTAGLNIEPPAKYDEHKCNTQTKPLVDREWEFQKLAVGESFAVESSGGKFTLTAGGKTITCGTVADTGTIESGGKDKATTITFKTCKAGTNGCEVKNTGGAFGTVVVAEIPTKLEEVGSKLVDKFEQKLVGTTKEFVTLEFNGATCAGEGYVTTKVKGDVAAEVKNEANGEVKLTFPSTPIAQTPKLEAFGVAATLVGTDNEKLENGWAFRAS
jgi:hypothetical protein